MDTAEQGPTTTKDGGIATAPWDELGDIMMGGCSGGGEGGPTTTATSVLSTIIPTALQCGDALQCGTVGAALYDDDGNMLPSFLRGCKHLVKSNGMIVGKEIANYIYPKYPTLLSVIPNRDEQGPAFIASIDGRAPITHSTVYDFIQEMGPTLHSLGIGRGHRVALVLPNGPELALAILAVSQWTGCVPLSATGAEQELAADLQRCGADLIIGPYCVGPLPSSTTTLSSTSEQEELQHTGSSSSPRSSSNHIPAELKWLGEKFNVLGDSSSNNNRDWTVHHGVADVAIELDIPFVGLVPDPNQAGPFRLWIPPEGRKKTRSTLRTHQSVPIRYDDIPIVAGRCILSEQNMMKSNGGKILGGPSNDNDRYKPNSGHDEALVLFTSGTTGNKKLVPHEIGDILTAATTIALSWELLPSDVNCNLMPLFHVGGIIRQVYSPLVSGGAVICCPSFDADLFWALLKRSAFNWYYAAPTMHQIILQTGKGMMTVKEMQSYPLKMIANAAGGLLPSLAQEMKDTFGAAVLPSYGMTECMPISSPPANYALDKPGTSGVPVGPEVAILNTMTMISLPPREEGPICVRGDPCFRGYGVLATDDPSAPKPESFLKDGWFNTGDLGFLDEDGYLYITGRSKEVINRGGEIISPMEVEEAVISHPDVQACAAFAADHDVLQETVGIVIVAEPGRTRSLDLPTLHAYIAEKLATPKWPQCLVYMKGGLPKSHTNKLLRVKLGSRLGLPEFNDGMSYWERTFDADCPAQGAPLDEAIPSKQVTTDPDEVQDVLRNWTKSKNIWVVSHPQRKGALVAHVAKDVDPLKLIKTATEKLHRYEVPTHICEVSNPKLVSTRQLIKIIPKPREAVASILSGGGGGSGNGTAGGGDPMIAQVQDVFLELLGLDYIPAPDADFFQIGGSSMTASQLASKIRKTFDIPFAGAEVFHHSTSLNLVELIKSRMDDAAKDDEPKPKGSSLNRRFHLASFEPSRMQPSNTVLSALVQLVPMFFLFPAWQISRYLLFFATLMNHWRMFPGTSDRSFSTFLVAYAIFHILWVTLAPLVFVAIKWIVIGKYKAGRYPIGGQYYLRWWFVDICRKLFLRGIWGSSDMTLRWYYRMLGAKIEKGARISLDCNIAEYDLVYVGKNAAVELCTLRGFGVDNGAMLLGMVRVGRDASVGLRSVVAPNTSVPDGQHLGPGTSTYDDTPGKAWSPRHARVNRKFIPEPSAALQLLLGLPLIVFVNVVAQIPPMAVMYGLLFYKSRENSEHFFSTWNELLDWLCDPRRIPFFFGIRVARALLSPFFYMGAALVVKRLFIGKFQAGEIKSDWLRFRISLASSLFTRKKVQSVADLIGRHYENVSILYRFLGAKVGKRVFWPGNQPTCNGMFDLLEVGDDVVFGSRSALLTASIDRCDKVILCAGANVSDNCLVMPGSVISKNAVLGSNSICPEGKFLAAGSVWFGATGAESQCLEPGDGSDAMQYQRLDDHKPPGSDPLGKQKDGTNAFMGPPVIASAVVDMLRLQMVGDETTIRPFGKAVYQGGAKGYWSWPINLVVAYTWFWRAFCCIFHTVPLLFAVQMAAVLLYSDDIKGTIYDAVVGEGDGEEVYNGQKEGPDGEVYNEDHFMGFERDFANGGHTYWDVFLAVYVCYVVTHFARVIGWLIIELSAKWGIMGRRKPGRYNYDTSSYAQRWEIYQLTAKIRKLSRLNLLEFITGTPYMSWYFRLNGGKVGRDVCLYPAGADPMMPEPDMVTIGDRSVVDCSSVVCHLNTRGNFELVPIVIEPECTLRTQSRVQQGVHMETGSMLLEKSIAMTGEVLDRRSVWQGGPATMWFQYSDSEVYRNGYTPPIAEDYGEKDIEMGSVRKD